MYPSPAVSDSDYWPLGLMHMCMSESESLCTCMTEVQSESESLCTCMTEVIPNSAYVWSNSTYVWRIPLGTNLVQIFRLYICICYTTLIAISRERKEIIRFIPDIWESEIQQYLIYSIKALIENRFLHKAFQRYF